MNDAAPTQPKPPAGLVRDDGKNNYIANSLGVCCMCGWPFAWSGGDPTRLGYALYKCEHVYMGDGGQGFYNRLFWNMEKSHILHTHLNRIFMGMAVDPYEERKNEMAQCILRFLFFFKLKGETVFDTTYDKASSNIQDKYHDNVKILSKYMYLMQGVLDLKIVDKMQDWIENYNTITKPINRTVEEISSADTDATILFGNALQLKLVYFFCIASLHGKREPKKQKGDRVADMYMDIFYFAENMPKILGNILDISTEISVQIHETLRNGDLFCKDGEIIDTGDDNPHDNSDDDDEKDDEEKDDEEKDDEEEIDEEEIDDDGKEDTDPRDESEDEGIASKGPTTRGRGKNSKKYKERSNSLSSEEIADELTDEEEKMYDEQAGQDEKDQDEKDTSTYENREKNRSKAKITWALKDQTIGCCYGCNRQMTMIKEFKHCTAAMLDLEEFSTTSRQPKPETVATLFEKMKRDISNPDMRFGIRKSDNQYNFDWPNYDWALHAQKFTDRGHDKSAKTKSSRQKYIKAEQKANYSFYPISIALYDLMLSLVMTLVDMRFKLLCKDDNDRGQTGTEHERWRLYYRSHQHRVQEHVKYVIMCNMQVIACNFMDDYIGKKPKGKRFTSDGEAIGNIQKKHLYRSCAALYTAAIVYKSVQMFHHRVLSMEKTPNFGFSEMTIGLTEFWKYIFVESAYYRLKDRKPDYNGFETPYMAIFGRTGLGSSGTDVDLAADRIPEKLMVWFNKSIKCVSAIWSSNDLRFLLFVYRVVFHSEENITEIAHTLCPQCCGGFDVGEERCKKEHILYRLLSKSNKWLVSNVTRETLTQSMTNTRELYASAPSYLVQQLPTTNRMHAVEMFLRMAYIFNRDVQTEQLKKGIAFVLKNLLADKQPFGKPR